MATLIVHGDAVDGYIYGQGALGVYNDARDTSAGSDDSATGIVVGQYDDGALNIEIDRGFLSFTAALPVGAVITGGMLYLTAKQLPVVHFLVHLLDLAWTSPLASAQESNYDHALSAGVDEGVFLDTTTMVVDVEYSMAVDPAWINPSGTTRYALLSADDMGAIPPGPMDDARASFYSADQTGTSKDPRLEIEYTLPGPATTGPSKQVAIRVFNGESGEFLHEWSFAGDDLQLGFDLTGPVNAGSTVPWGSAFFGMSKLQPGGVPVVVEVDARGRGVSEVWTGQFSGVDVASGRGGRGVSFEGPSSWLDSEDAVVRSREVAQASPGPYIAGLLSTYPLDLRLDISPDIYQGPGLPIALNGQSVAGLMTEVAGMTGEEPVMYSRPGTGRLWFAWTSAFAPLDQSPVVALGEGRHVEWSYTGAVLARSELTVMGQSFDAGNRVRSVAARAVGGRVLGRKAALAAVLEEYAPRSSAELKDGSGVIVDPLEGATAALRSMVMTNLRRWITPRYPIVITLTDIDLWPLIKRGCLLRVQFPSDDFGIYQDAVIRVQTIGWKLGGQAACEIGAELWETAASFG